MRMETKYQPIKAFHPGETLAEKLQELEMSVSDFSAQAGLPAFMVESIIAGTMSVTADMALAFEQVTLIPAHYWLNAQHNYDEYLLSTEASSYRSRLAESQAQLASTIVNSVMYIPIVNSQSAFAR